jgi:hypothetical protein
VVCQNEATGVENWEIKQILGEATGLKLYISPDFESPVNSVKIPKQMARNIKLHNLEFPEI